MPVSVVPHDAAWRQKFAIEADEIRRALGRNVLAVHHIGSTAVPGILAKPIVDILVDVSRIEGVDEQTERMDELGFEACGEYGVRGRR